MRSPEKLAFAHSPAGLFAILAASLAVAEVIVMLLLAELPAMPPLLTYFFAATLLIALAFPALHAFAFKPLLRHLWAREEAEEQLHEANRTLEQHVEARTKELACEQARFRVIFESVPIGFTWMRVGDIASRIVNPAHARITGVPPERRDQLELYRLATHPDDRARQDDLHRRLLAGEFDHYDIEKRYVHGDGSVRWSALSVHLLRDIAGRETQEINTVVDITERKQAEARLAEASGLLKAMLENSPDTIYFKDTQSRFLLASQSKVRAAIERLPDLRERRVAKGLPPDVPELELLNGLTDFDTFHSEDARVAFEDEQQLIRGGQPVIGKVEKHVFLDGAVRWHLTSKMPWRDGDGRVIGTFGISKDITDLKEAEEKLAQLHHQLLETSRKAGMAEVATDVLHNVGNVLNSVNVSATLIADCIRHTKVGNVAKLSALFAENKANLADFLTKDARGQMIPGYLESLTEMLTDEHRTITLELDQLQKNIDHIKDIVATQQAYARMSGVIETVSIPDVVEDALRISAGSLSRHDVQTVRDYRARPVVTTDKHKIIQILINLLRNAKYACDESGRTDKKVVIRTTAGERGIQIAIIDNGAGIAPEILPRIFEHGFTTRKDGHGFGLHSAALAAKELGGTLSAQSDGPGRGATFSLELPYTSEATNHDSSAA